MWSVLKEVAPAILDDGSAGFPWAQMAPNAPYTHSVSVLTDRRQGSTTRLGERLAQAAGAQTVPVRTRVDLALNICFPAGGVDRPWPVRLIINRRLQVIGR